MVAPWHNIERKNQPANRVRSTKDQKVKRQSESRRRHEELLDLTHKYRGANGQRIKKPSQYTEEMGDEILNRISDGEYDIGISYDAHMPTVGVMRKWREGKNGAPISWASGYARARIDQANAMAYEILVLADGADDAVRCHAEQALKNLPEDASPADRRRAQFYAKSRSIEATKLAIEARKWITSKLNPAQWSEKVTVDVNANATASIQIDFTKLTVEQLERISELRALLSAGTDDDKGEIVDITPVAIPETVSS